jgi:hypothetical protein
LTFSLAAFFTSMSNDHLFELFNAIVTYNMKLQGADFSVTFNKKLWFTNKIYIQIWLGKNNRKTIKHQIWNKRLNLKKKNCGNRPNPHMTVNHSFFRLQLTWIERPYAICSKGGLWGQCLNDTSVDVDCILNIMIIL